MLADGLAQYLVWKQWKRWLLVAGSHDDDKLFAEALRRSATRFGAKIVQERVFEDTGGARRTDSGVTLIQRQMPVFTQSAPAYDILVAADESEVFASYLPYRTWDPRPVAGSAGLVPKSWDAAQDQWGAVQMQNRFLKLNARRMTALDMQAWIAARMIGEAVSRVQFRRPQDGARFPQGSGFFHRGIQGPAADAARLEPAAAAADPSGGWPHGRFRIAAGRISASGLGTRYARRRPARDQMQAALKMERAWMRCHRLLFGSDRLACRRRAGLCLHRLCVE